MAEARMSHPTKTSSPAWSLKGKKLRSYETDNPGPAAYNPAPDGVRTGGLFGTS
jgi:hypothetical protein